MEIGKMEKINLYNSEKLIKEIRDLQGAEVYIFGQKQKMSSKVPEFCYDTCEVIEQIKDNEVSLLDLIEHYNIPIKEEILDDSKYDVNYELANILAKQGILEETGSDNSYNWNSNVYHDFEFSQYKAVDINDIEEEVYYVVLSVHKYGDVRGNYTDSVVYKFDYDTEFLERLDECCKDVEVCYKKINYLVEINVMHESLELYSNDKNFEELGSVYGVDRPDIEQSIQEWVDERNEKVKEGDTIRVLQVSNSDLQDLLDYEFKDNLAKVESINRKTNQMHIEFIDSEYRITIELADLFKIE